MDIPDKMAPMKLETSYDTQSRWNPIIAQRFLECFSITPEPTNTEGNDT